MTSGIRFLPFCVCGLVLLIAGCINSPNNRVSDVPVMDGVMHQASAGETVEDIARTYEVSPQLIMRVNGLTSGADFPTTRQLFIPGVDEIRVVERTTVSTQPTSVTVREPGVSHVVRPGETIVAIARAYEITVREIQQVNNIADPSQIRAGQILWIPRALEVKDVEVPTVTIKTFEPTAVPTQEPRVVVQVVPTPTPKPVPTAEANMQQFPRDVKEYADIRFQWPIKERFRVVKPFSVSSDPRESNQGIDLGAPIGTTVYAAADGEVRVVGGLADTFGSTWGNHLFIYHGDKGGQGIYTIYGHNSEILVEKGDRVERGDPIAKIGNTGISPVSSGGALHFQVREGADVINPITILPSLQDS